MMITDTELLREQWRIVANGLGIDFVAPISVSLPDGSRWEFAALLPQFGGKRGMLIASEYSAPAFTAAKEAGYCISCMGAEHRHVPIDPESYIDCLVDWGWVGKAAAPVWYTGAA